MTTNQMNCERCGKPCQSGIGNPEARLLKRSDKGLCADCALTAFLKTETPFEYAVQNNGIEILRDANIRLQIAQLLIAGKSDATIDEIDMERVIANWNLPVKKEKG